MHFSVKFFAGRFLSRLKLTTAISFVFFVLLMSSACSNEEQQETGPHKMVVSIKKPVQKSTDALLTGKKAMSKSVSLTTKKNAPMEKEGPVLPSNVEKPREGYYKVIKGDTLFKIAGKEEAYGNPFKWPSLFLHNMGILKDMEVSGNFDKKELPEGLDLKFTTSKEAMKNLKKLKQKPWAVNIFSSQTTQEMVPLAVKLMKKNYPVYIVKAKIKGANWIRLRVGFFKNAAEARVVSKKISSIVDVHDAWITKIEKKEFEEFGGY